MMMASPPAPAPPPPPPPPAPPASAAQAPPPSDGRTSSAPVVPFVVTGSSREEMVVELRDVKSQLPSGSQPLRAVLHRYLSSPQMRSFPMDRLELVLGRLRCLHFAITRYNEGIVAMAAAGNQDDHNAAKAFTQYWRPHTLELLSSFGFQVTSATQPVVVVGLEELIAAIETANAEEIAAARELITNGQVVFEALGELYRPDTPVQGVTGALGGTPGVFLVSDYYYEERRSLMGPERSFHCVFEFIATMGEHFTVVRFTEVLSGWTGVRTRPLTELTYVPLRHDQTELREMLQRRGDNYGAIVAGAPRFLAYAPHSFFVHRTAKATTPSMTLAHSGSSQLHKGGRILIDPARGAILGHHASQGSDEPTHAMILLAGRYRRWYNAQSGNGVKASGTDGMLLWTSVPHELAIYCWPAVVGFSFTAKAWGHALVGDLSPIVFNDSAFDQLVLAEDRKQLIRALVRFGGAADSSNGGLDIDIIAGKRGGSVFLLHGPPGVGKTLTAEAIAEVLHRPLYYVTMGELGLSPDELESRLSDVLELCANWNALVLLDEADVFLEARNSSADIVRNAMVCVMLRLLEYHSGILFLTTNRVRTFDPAFESRVTVALHYDDLTPSARTQIWRNLLQRVDGNLPLAPDIDVDRLGAQHVINGRQIKNVVRLAVALAHEQNNPALTQAILETTLAITRMGLNAMHTDDSWGRK